MRKSLFIVLCTCMVLLAGTVTTFAAEQNLLTSAKTCVLLVAPADMKTADYMKIVDDVFKEDSPIGNVAFGTPVQTKYQEYWLNKGELEEGKLTKDILIDFVKFSGYEQCLFLIASSNIEKTQLRELTPKS